MRQIIHHKKLHLIRGKHTILFTSTVPVPLQTNLLKLSLDTDPELDQDPHSSKRLDPIMYCIMNADPKLCFLDIFTKIHKYFIKANSVCRETRIFLLCIT
jgi:hypothetical protein